ncbi:hypothetical protein T02_14083, partial [Trichinella nativa]
LKRPSTLLKEDRVSQPLSPFQLLTDIDYVDLPATEDRDPDWRPSGTSILILEDNLPQTCCLIGVISQLFPGRDRVVRAAQILTSKGEVTRLVAKLVVLVPASVANGEEDSSSRGKIVDDKTRSPEQEFTASIAVNTFTSVSVLAISLAWFRILLKKEAGLGLLTATALLQLYYSRKYVYTLLSKWGYGGRDILGIISVVGHGTVDRPWLLFDMAVRISGFQAVSNDLDLFREQLQDGLTVKEQLNAVTLHLNKSQVWLCDTENAIGNGKNVSGLKNTVKLQLGKTVGDALVYMTGKLCATFTAKRGDTAIQRPWQSLQKPPETDSAEDVLITPRTFNFESWTEQSPWTENVQSKAIGFITSVLNCDGCTLFDLDIMFNGDLVSVDAKHEKVIKMRSTGERLAERHVHGATRGVSVCMDDRIYVLVEGGPYDDVVYLLDVQNGNVTAIQPPENSVYGLGMCSSVNVFAKDGQF